MKQFIKTTILLLAILLPSLANAYDFMVDGLCYNIINENEVKVTYWRSVATNNYNTATYYSDEIDEDIVIPATVIYNDKEYIVKAVGWQAFQNCWFLKSVVIPNSVSVIEAYSFLNSGLKRLTMPCSAFIGSAASGAFTRCDITTIVLTGNGAFQQQYYDTLEPSQFKNIIIGSGIVSLGDVGFSPESVYCYAELPPSCTSTTFSNYNGTLHVLPTSTIAYFTADYWQNFEIVNDLSEKVFISGTEANIIINETHQLSATTNTNDSKLLWSTSNPAIAKVSEDGIVTAIGEGECDIFATLESNIAVYASCHIISSYPEITALTLNENEIVFSNIGDTFTLIATTNPENSGPSPTWASSDETVATVDDDGVVTAMGEGECDISVTVLDKTATCHVTVTSTIIISLDQQEAMLLPNHIINLIPSGSPVMPEGFTVTNSDPMVAAARLVNDKVQVVGIKEGTTTITVGSTDGKAVPATCLVTVYTESGDVNCDGFVDINDVTGLIDYVLTGNNANLKAANADFNNDSFIDIDDITALIDHVLGK